jgi:rubrerythrin
MESRNAEGPALIRDGIPEFLLAGHRALGEFRCTECGYGISVRRTLPECPMCRGSQWEEPATSPYGRVLP